MTPKEFLLNKYPKSKYDDCPIPKEYWSEMQAYAEAFYIDKVKRSKLPKRKGKNEGSFFECWDKD